MYNPEVKTAFMNDYTSSEGFRRLVLYLFRQTQPFEEAADADLCTMNAESLKPVISAVMTASSDGSRVKRSVLRDYFKWCRDHGIPNAGDGISRVDFDNSFAVKRKMVGSPLQLQRYLNEAYGPETDSGIDCIYRCVFWLAYAGLPKENIPDITAADVRIDLMLIEFNGRAYPIYKEGLSVIRKCAELSSLWYKGPSKGGEGKWVGRLPGNKLIRSIKGDQGMWFVLRIFNAASASVRENSNLDLRLNYFGVWLSGFCYRMYEQEILTGSVDFVSAAREMLAEKNYTFTGEKGNSVAGYKDRVRNLARQYQKNYESWKDVFVK